MDVAVSRRLALLVLPLVVSLAGCDMAHLAAKASDEWTHTYPLNAGGEIRIVNTNGTVDVEGVDGNTVEIRAEKIARSATEDAARELLPRINIKEEKSADRISLETERMSGIMIGASFEVQYHVRAPRNAVINVTNTNGLVTVKAMSGQVTAHTTNGGVKGTNLSGAVDARTTNGGVSVDMASVGSGRISLETTNGGVTLALPEKAKASISAACTNGGISVGSLDNFEVSEHSRRHLEGKLNGGGTAIDLQTTNGGIRLRSHNSLPDAPRETDSDDRKDR